MLHSSILLFFTAVFITSCAVTSGTSQERLRTSGMRTCTARDVVDDHCTQDVSRAKSPDNSAKY